MYVRMSTLKPKPGGEFDVSDDPDDWLCWWDAMMLTESSSLSMSSKPSPSSRTYVHILYVIYVCILTVHSYMHAYLSIHAMHLQYIHRYVQYRYTTHLLEG